MVEDLTEEESSGRDFVVPAIEVVRKGGGDSMLIKKQDEERPATPDLYGEIEIGLQRTRNLGNYNSGQVRISLRLPVAPKKDSIDKMADWLLKYIKGRLQQELDEMER